MTIRLTNHNYNLILPLFEDAGSKLDLLPDIAADRGDGSRSRVYLPDRPYVFLSSGLGVDSTALTILCLTDHRFARYRPDFIVFSDTGAEMPYTQEIVLPALNTWLSKQGYCNLDGSQGVIVLGCNDLRYRTKSRLGALHEWHMLRKSPGIPTRKIRSCTDGAKVAPVRRFVNQQKDLRFGKWKPYGQRHQMLIGIAVDEADRADGLNILVPKDAQYLEHRFPLIEFGLTKADCIALLAKHGIPAWKSGCYLCPFQPISKFWAVRRLYPDLHRNSVEMEALAAARNPNLRILGRPGLSLDEELARWEQRQLKKHGSLPDPWEVLVSNYKLNRCWSDRAVVRSAAAVVQNEGDSEGEAA